MVLTLKQTCVKWNSTATVLAIIWMAVVTDCSFCIQIFGITRLINVALGMYKL